MIDTLYMNSDSKNLHMYLPLPVFTFNWEDHFEALCIQAHTYKNAYVIA